MDKRPNKSTTVTRKRPTAVRPDFEAWDIKPAPTSLLHHPLLTKGGPIAIAALAIIGFVYLAVQCLGETTLSETARIMGLLILAGLIFATVVIVAKLLREEGKHATDKASRKRTNQSRSKSDGP